MKDGIALVISKRKPQMMMDEESGSDDKLVGLMEDFVAAKSAKDKAEAMRLFIEACCSGDEDSEEE